MLGQNKRSHKDLLCIQERPSHRRKQAKILPPVTHGHDFVIF